ncbi:IS5 family transposase [Streptomyces sp. NPDC054844]
MKWRAMHADFPPWDRVYAFFRRWRDHALVKEFHDRLRSRICEREGRDAEPTAGVIDSQSVKADAVVGSDSRGRHVVVDTVGLLLGVIVTAADTGDRGAAQVLLGQVADAHHRLELVWADGGYTGPLVEYCLATLALVLAIVKRSDDMRGFVVLPKRWIVERLFAHLMRTRRLARDYERRTTSAEAMIYWSMILLMPRRNARPTPCTSTNGPARAQSAQPRATSGFLAGAAHGAPGDGPTPSRPLPDSTATAERIRSALVKEPSRRAVTSAISSRQASNLVVSRSSCNLRVRHGHAEAVQLVAGGQTRRRRSHAQAVMLAPRVEESPVPISYAPSRSFVTTSCGTGAARWRSGAVPHAGPPRAKRTGARDRIALVPDGRPALVRRWAGALSSPGRHAVITSGRLRALHSHH